LKNPEEQLKTKIKEIYQRVVSNPDEKYEKLIESLDIFQEQPEITQEGIQDVMSACYEIAETNLIEELESFGELRKRV
jgi:hypothetical protein